MTENIFDHRGGRIYFVGAGGCSMSGLALLLKQEGFQVSGSDRTRSHKTELLERQGIPVAIGHDAKNVHGADAIVYTAAVSPENPERAEARALGIPEIERCDLIGQLMLGSRFAVGVSGTHGKTTTTAMLAQVFLEAGADPTIHIGGELDFIGGSTRLGQGGDFLCEACEFNRSFLHFHPTVAIILNIDEDHLDCYRDIDDIESAFAQYAALVPDDGWVIAWGDDERARRVAENAACPCIPYGLGAHNRLRPEHLRYDEAGRAEFDAVLDGRTLGHFHLAVATEANMLDALAVIATAAVRGLPMDAVSRALASFQGAHRRFERTSVTDGVSVYTDYGHNPAEIKNAIKLATLQPHGKIWSVWQPHTYSRTKKLFDSFISTFDQADVLLITDICGARETDPGDISSQMLVEPIRARGVEVHLTPTFDDAEAYLRGHWQKGDLVITHGCGDIDLLNEQIALHGDTEDMRRA
ncbi:MAG: UDP-N-acetylmuramate--L-alanine ligase [Eubacteriales bacterium]|nr:UDP-N-acetylmuramate--L-alanine ligase [Eubacteriales bacterium]